MTRIDYIILGVVAVCFAAAVYCSFFKKKKGGCCSGCSECKSACKESGRCGTTDKGKQ